MAKNEQAGFEVGDKVRFLGYEDDVPEKDRVLEEGEVYEVEEVGSEEDPEAIALRAPNPAFDAKKRATKNNPETVLVDVFPDEIELAGEGDENGEEADDADEAEEADEKPARGRAAKKEEVKPAAKAKPGKGKAAKEEADEKPAAKGKAPAKAAAKGKVPAKTAPKEEKEEVDEDALPDLENEDEEVAGLVAEAEDVLALADELVEEENALAYRLGGVLYHIRKGKLHHDADERYKEKGGFGLYVKERLNVEYRKAMNLIEIYVRFNQAGISGEKVAEIGWTKASKIAAVMSQQIKAGVDDDKVAEIGEELLEVAAESSVTDLSETIKESYKEVGGTKGERKKMTTFKFKLFEDQAEGVTNVLKSTAAAMGFKKIDEAFEYIVMEWAAEHPVEEAAPATDKASRRTADKAATKPGRTAGKPVRASARA